MSRRTLGFVIFAAVVAAACVRLGFWQLDRREQRRALNATLASRLAGDPAPAFDVMRESATAQFRRAVARGTYDFANEVAVGSRTHQGSPGVHVLTPLRIPGRDTALLVNRGWAYSPDAMSVDLGRWVEAERRLKETPTLLKTPAGYVQPSPWLAISNKSVELMHKFAAELGLSPASRSRTSSSSRTAPSRPSPPSRTNAWPSAWASCSTRATACAGRR